MGCRRPPLGGRRHLIGESNFIIIIITIIIIIIISIIVIIVIIIISIIIRPQAGGTRRLGPRPAPPALRRGRARRGRPPRAEDRTTI